MSADLDVVNVVNRAVGVEHQLRGALADHVHEPEHAVDVEADADRLDPRDLLFPLVAALLGTHVQLDAAEQFLKLPGLVRHVNREPPLVHHATIFARCSRSWRRYPLQTRAEIQGSVFAAPNEVARLQLREGGRDSSAFHESVFARARPYGLNRRLARTL